MVRYVGSPSSAIHPEQYHPSTRTRKTLSVGSTHKFIGPELDHLSTRTSTAWTNGCSGSGRMALSAHRIMGVRADGWYCLRTVP